MASKPKVPPPAPPPAARPERQRAAEPEDIVLGGEDEIDMDTSKRRGKRALIRPTSGLAI